MNKAKSSIMITLFSCMSQGKNHYTVVSIDKIIDLLKDYHKIQVKRRWIFYCIRDLLDAGLLTRKPRYQQGTGCTISQVSSMISFTLKGARYLVSKRVNGAWRMWKRIVSYLKNNDHRWPKMKEIVKPDESEAFKPSLDDWNSLRGIVGKRI